MAHNQASTHKGVRNDHLREAVRTIDNITEATDCREAKPSLKCSDTTGCDMTAASAGKICNKTARRINARRARCPGYHTGISFTTLPWLIEKDPCHSSYDGNGNHQTGRQAQTTDSNDDAARQENIVPPHTDKGARSHK